MNNKKTSIFLTIDYELFLGKNTGSVINCMIRPLDMLIEILDNYKIKATIFVDAAYLIKVNELKHRYKSLEKDYELILKQIQRLSENGHDIQLHIHPQWLYSEYSVNGWKIETQPYKLSDLEPSDAKTLFAKAKSLLEQIINKPIYVFRAGGYSLQTYTGYAELFSENGILIDSSVLKGAVTKSDFQEYDFRLCPRYGRYKFTDNLMLEDPTGKFFELPIFRHQVSFFYYVYKKLLINRQYDRTKIGDGTGIGDFIKNKPSILFKLFHLFVDNYRTASIDTYSSVYLTYLFEKHRGTNSEDFVIIGHPKNFSVLSLHHLEQFIKRQKGNSRFLTVSSIVKFCK